MNSLKIIIIINENIKINKLINEYKLSMEILRNIGLCIDLNCSGNNMVGNKIYRVFNSFFELRDHFRKPNMEKLLYGSWSEDFYIEDRFTKDNINIIKYDEYIEKEKNQIAENKEKSNSQDKEKNYENIKEDSDNSWDSNNDKDVKKEKKRDVRKTKKVINFIQNYKKEKDIEMDYIYKLGIKKMKI